MSVSTSTSTKRPARELSGQALARVRSDARVLVHDLEYASRRARVAALDIARGRVFSPEMASESAETVWRRLVNGDAYLAQLLDEERDAALHAEVMAYVRRHARVTVHDFARDRVDGFDPPDLARDHEVAYQLAAAARRRLLAGDLQLVRELAGERDATLYRDLDLALETARDLEFGRALDRARDLAYSRVFLLDGPDRDVLARDFALLIYRDLHTAIAPNLARIRMLDHRLAHALGRAHSNAARLCRTLQCPAAVDGGEDAAVRVSRFAVLVTGLAVGLLPVSQRDRYSAEFASELYEMAQGRRWASWRYAFGTLVVAHSLRRALTDAQGARVAQRRAP